MEVIKSFKIGGRHVSLWRGRDAEGRTAYAVTADQLGMPREPVSLTHYSQRSAIKAAREDYATEGK